MILQDKVAIVSGIGPGLGSHLAKLAAKDGAQTVLAARTQENLDSTEKEILEMGVSPDNILKVPTDICDKTACKELVAKTLEKFGRIDVLFNSAFDPGTFGMVDSVYLEEWRRPLEVNYFGTLNLTQATVPAMRENGGGSIIMINTMVCHKEMPSQGGYAASKAALAAASQHLAREVGPDNIRVNSLYMGWMWGPAVKIYVGFLAQEQGVDVETVKASIAEDIALGRIPTDEECGKAAMFFASDYSSAVTGAALDVNGGHYMPH